MSSRFKKITLAVLAALLLAGAGGVQRSLNRDRDELGLTRIDPLDNAPPVLAFTTVALGGFRGLIANALWIRASDLQDDGKYFEMVQLADWITKLEPHFVQVWLVQAWNMAYNISVKFKDAEDRWRWVQRGIELLRDDGLRFNPNEALIYRELAWFFHHKMGQNLDDAHMFYKVSWADEMTEVLGGGKPDFDALINPQTDESRERAQLLREKYKLDPAFMREVNEKYGPLDWRLPETHSIYWASLGLEKISSSEKANKEDLRTLRRAIFQSMQLSFLRGRLVRTPLLPFDLGPNLDIIDKVSAAYEEMIEAEPELRENFKNAHRNFLIRGVFFLYTYNREAEAAKWFRHLREKYPNKPLLENRPDSLPGNLTLDQFVVARVESEVGETSLENLKAVVEGYLVRYYYHLATGQEDQAIAAERIARQVHARFKAKTEDIEDRLPFPPLNDMKREVLGRVLDPETGFPPVMANQLRTALGLPAPTNAPPAGAAPSSQ